MSTTYTPRPRKSNIYDKAERLVREERYEKIRSSGDGSFWVGVCNGDNGRYPVFAIAQWFMDAHGITGGRVGCKCRFGSPGGLCSHALGAEAKRKEEEEEEEDE